MIERAAIIAAARELLGTPFRHQGRLPGKALDCIGVPLTVAWALGIETPDFRAYNRNPDGRMMHRELSRRMDWTAKAEPGDLIEMTMVGPFPHHVGIVSELHGVRHLIHAYRPVKMVVEQPMDTLPGRVIGAFAFPGVC